MVNTLLDAFADWRWTALGIPSQSIDTLKDLLGRPRNLPPVGRQSAHVKSLCRTG